MEDIKLSWTKDEFLAYLIIYAAQINQIETEEEKEFIESRFDSKTLKKIYKEILSLPMYPQLTRSNQDYVIKSIKSILATVANGKYA